MDPIREALIKAKASLDERPAVAAAQAKPTALKDVIHQVQSSPGENPSIREVQLRPRQMERSRIVSYGMSDEKHVAFNLLRTRVRGVLRDNKWKTMAVTSPTPRCGKTTVALNLAFSLSRAPECRVVLVDLDLRKPGIAKTLGVDVTGSVGRFLRGEGSAEQCFVRIAPNLIVGLANDRIQESSELIQGPRMKELLGYIDRSLKPDVVIFDLPPMLRSDDALAFLPQVDGALLVVASKSTTAKEAQECEAQITQLGKLVGVTLNKADVFEEEYY